MTITSQRQLKEVLSKATIKECFYWKWDRVLYPTLQIDDRVWHCIKIKKFFSDVNGGINPNIIKLFRTYAVKNEIPE